MDEDALEQGAAAEAALTLARIRAVASGVRAVGSRLAFTFWAEHGALTLTGYTASGRNGPLGQEVIPESLQHTLKTIITRFAQEHTGEVVVILVRGESGWNAEYKSSQQAPRPAEAKTLPVRREGLPTDVVEAATEGINRLLSSVTVSAGGEALVDVAVHLEDGRVEDWSPLLFEVTRGNPGSIVRQPGPYVMNEATAVLLPFTQGIGERTVHMRLRLALSHGAQRTSGWVEEARVVRPLPPPGTNAEFVAEYRALHEDILRRWREETKEGAVWVARQGATELAYWYVGGVILKGTAWLGARVAPTVLRALSQGGARAAGWLRTTLSRVSVDKRQTFERLWAKVQLEGKRSLSKAEREELRLLMDDIERLVRTPLDTQAKKRLRADAREAYRRLHPELAKVLNEKGAELPIHHRRQLEHAHLFPEEDINSADNLAMVKDDVHDRLNSLWNKFRRARPQATAQEVEAAGKVIDDRFQPWYHQPSEPPHVPYSLKEAEETALRTLQRLFPGLE
jgi:hypothetical protein